SRRSWPGTYRPGNGQIAHPTFHRRHLVRQLRTAFGQRGNWSTASHSASRRALGPCPQRSLGSCEPRRWTGFVGDRQETTPPPLGTRSAFVRSRGPRDGRLDVHFGGTAQGEPLEHPANRPVTFRPLPVIEIPGLEYLCK